MHLVLDNEAFAETGRGEQHLVEAGMHMHRLARAFGAQLPAGGRQRVGLDAGDAGTGAGLEVGGLAGQLQEGSGRLLACDDLGHLLQRLGAFDEVARGELLAGSALAIQHDHGVGLLGLPAGAIAHGSLVSNSRSLGLTLQAI